MNHYLNYSFIIYALIILKLSTLIILFKVILSIITYKLELVLTYCKNFF